MITLVVISALYWIAHGVALMLEDGSPTPSVPGGTVANYIQITNSPRRGHRKRWRERGNPNMKFPSKRASGFPGCWACSVDMISVSVPGQGTAKTN